MSEERTFDIPTLSEDAARTWWMNRRGQSENDSADELVELLGTSPATIITTVETLLRAAAPSDELSLIGVWVVEGYGDLYGPLAVLEMLRLSSIQDSDKSAILGTWWEPTIGTWDQDRLVGARRLDPLWQSRAEQLTPEQQARRRAQVEAARGDVVAFVTRTIDEEELVARARSRSLGEGPRT